MIAHAEDAYLFLGGVIAASAAVMYAIRTFIRSRS